jgi:hypothetical protein
MRGKKANQTSPLPTGRLFDWTWKRRVSYINDCELQAKLGVLLSPGAGLWVAQ